jgi:hypothetical protein
VPDGSSDEVWVSDTSDFTNVWFKIPKALTLVDGTPKVFAPGALDHNILAA